MKKRKSMPRMSRLLLAAATVILWQHGACGADPFTGMDAYIHEGMARWEIPGLAIAVVKDGEVVLARGYGVGTLGGNRPVTEDTVFPIASCTKSFTAATIGMLFDEGKITWDDAVQKHLPDFAVADRYVSEHATLRDLLCHRTGLARGDLLSVKGDLTNDEIFSRTRLLGQAKPFRTSFTYHNVMYGVLGRIVAEKSGMPWEAFVARRIFEPLGMESTTAIEANIPADRRATRHRLYDGKVLPLQKPAHYDLVAPAGAIHSTVVDMATWLKFQLREGEDDGRRLLQADTVREMHALQHSIPIKSRAGANIWSTKFAGTGLGWFAREYRGRKVVQHGGAWGADTAIVPPEDLGDVVLSTLDHNGFVWLLIFDVIDAYLAGPESAWTKGDKWDRWDAIGGPGLVDRARAEHKAELEKDRAVDTRPTLPLAAYAGSFVSDLYGMLEISQQGDLLAVRFGDHAGELTHWQDDMFYGRGIVEPYLDWLVKFRVGDDRAVEEFEIVAVGWKDPDERHFFTRRKSR